MSKQLIHTNVETPTMRRSRRGLRWQKPPLRVKEIWAIRIRLQLGYAISRCSISQSIANYGLAISLL